MAINQDGFDEAADRARNNPAPSTTVANNPAYTWNGVVGGKTVTMGGGAPITDEQAMDNLRQQSADMDSRAQTDPAYWRALHPEASNEDFQAYSKANKQYEASMHPGNAITKVGKAAKFEVNRIGKIASAVAHDPSRLLTGVDPASTGIWNKALGTDNKPIVGQFGGATGEDLDSYEAKHGRGSLGAARSLSKTGDMVAGMFGAAGAAHGLSEAAGAFTPGNGAPTGDDLGIFSNGGREGMSQVGLSNAERLAASGAIKGGAGVGIGSSIVAGGKYAKLANDAISVVNRISASRGGASAAPTDTSGVSSNPSDFSTRDHGPLRRFERTPETLFTDMRNGANPMKVAKIIPRATPVAPPTRVAAPVKSPVVPRSSPKTPPAVNYARQQGLSDVKKIPRAPTRAASY